MVVSIKRDTCSIYCKKYTVPAVMAILSSSFLYTTLVAQLNNHLHTFSFVFDDADLFIITRVTVCFPCSTWQCGVVTQYNVMETCSEALLPYRINRMTGTILCSIMRSK